MSTSENTAYWFIFQENRLLFTKHNEQLTLLNQETLDSLMTSLSRQYALGSLQASSCFCAEIDVAVSLPNNIVAIPLRKAFELLGLDWFSLATKAFSVINWDRNHQYCGHCGNITIHKLGGFEKVCTVCGLSFYPRISPSVIVLIKKNEEILMARSPHFIPGAYGLIAGFVEIGESIEEAIHREVKEEVNLTIKNLHYFGSQPWPFPDSLMIGFMADYEAGDIQIDDRELEAAGWYHYDNLPGRPSTPLSIASRMINHFVAEQSKRPLK